MRPSTWLVTLTSALALFGPGCADSSGDEVAVPADVEATPDVETAPEVSADTTAPDTAGCDCVDPGLPCQAVECQEGQCVVVAEPAGTACDDGLGCTTGEVCDGTQEPGACHASTTTCDDGEPCNGAESCTAEGCAPGAPLACSDGNPCNGIEICAPAKGLPRRGADHV